MLENVKFDDKTDAAASQIESSATLLVRQTVHTIEADIKGEMAKPKHGRTYTRGHVTHKASAPGEAPAIDHGDLANSVAVANDGDFASEVGTDKEYGALLEEGTGTIDPRPAWAEAGERAKNTFARNAQNLR